MEGNMKRLTGGLIMVALVSLLVTNSACAPRPTPTVTPKTIPSDLVIDYSWGACHADWGSYHLVINSKGEASFEKSQNLDEFFSQQSQFSLTEEELLRIYQEITSNNFFALDDEYRNPEVIDGECHLLIITAEGKEHAVSVSNRRIEAFDKITETITEILGGKIPDWEAFTPFEECVEAFSFEDYYEKAGIEEAGFPFEPEWMSEFLEPVPIPVRTNFPEVEIYNIPLERAGGDVYTNLIIKSGNLYCVLTDSNTEKLFAPIQKEEAIDYLIFREVTLGITEYQRQCDTVLTKEDYERISERGEYFCEKPVPEPEKRITTVQETKDGFLINWVYYTFFGERAGFYEHKVEIGYDAKIQYLEAADKPFIDCGPGAIF